MIEYVEISTQDNENLEDQILEAMGRSIEFSNGCSLHLTDAGGIYWGTDPYGIDWGCNADVGWLTTVLKCLAYWDEPRCERGGLLAQLDL